MPKVLGRKEAGAAAEAQLADAAACESMLDGTAGGGRGMDPHPHDKLSATHFHPPPRQPDALHALERQSQDTITAQQFAAGASTSATAFGLQAAPDDRRNQLRHAQLHPSVRRLEDLHVVSHARERLEPSPKKSPKAGGYGAVLEQRLSEDGRLAADFLAGPPASTSSSVNADRETPSNHFSLAQSPRPALQAEGAHTPRTLEKLLEVEAEMEFVPNSPRAVSSRTAPLWPTPPMSKPLRQSTPEHAALVKRSVALAKGFGNSVPVGSPVSPATGYDSLPDHLPSAGFSPLLQPLARVEDLQKQLQRKNDEIAMLAHLANETLQIPITVELSQHLSIAVAHSVSKAGPAFEAWLKQMEQQRQDQKDSALLLMEAREAMAQLIVHKVQEAEEGSRDLDLISDSIEEGLAVVEKTMATLEARLRELEAQRSFHSKSALEHEAAAKALRARVLQLQEKEEVACPQGHSEGSANEIQHKLAQLEEQKKEADSQIQLLREQFRMTKQTEKELEKQQREAETQIQQLEEQLARAKQSEKEQMSKLEQYKRDVTGGMTGVQTNLERLRVERTAILEDNKALKVEKESLQDDLALLEERVNEFKAQHEKALTTAAAEHTEQLQLLEAEHQKETAEFEKRLRESAIASNALRARVRQLSSARHGDERLHDSNNQACLGALQEEENSQQPLRGQEPRDTAQGANLMMDVLAAQPHADCQQEPISLSNRSRRAKKTAKYVNSKMGVLNVSNEDSSLDMDNAEQSCSSAGEESWVRIDAPKGEEVSTAVVRVQAGNWVSGVGGRCRGMSMAEYLQVLQGVGEEVDVQPAKFTLKLGAEMTEMKDLQLFEAELVFDIARAAVLPSTCVCFEQLHFDSMEVDLEISSPGDGRSPADIVTYLTLQICDDKSQLRQGVHTRKTTSLTTIKPISVLRQKYRDDVGRLEEEVVSASELVTNYRAEVMMLMDKSANLEAALADLQSTPRGARKSPTRCAPGVSAAQSSTEALKNSTRRPLQTRSSIGGTGFSDEDLVRQIGDLQAEVARGKSMYRTMKERNAVLARDKATLTDRLRQTKEHLEQTRRSLVYQQTPKPSNAEKRPAVITPRGSGGVIKGVPRLALGGAEATSLGQDTTLLTPRDMMPEDVRNLIRDNRRMSRSLSDMIAAKERTMEQMIEVQNECKELEKKAATAQKYQRQRDFLQERADKMATRLKDCEARLEVAEDALAVHRESLKDQARIQDRAVLAESQEKVLAQQLNAANKHTALLMSQVQDAQERMRKQSNRSWQRDIEIEKLRHVNNTLRDGAHDIKILMDGLQALMPELEVEARFVCQDRARLAEWATKQKSQKIPNPSLLKEEQELLEALRTETMVLRKEKEELEHAAETKKAGRSEVSSVEELEEEKSRLNEAVSQLQFTVEIYEKKLESDSNAQNAEILNLEAKLLKEEAAHKAETVEQQSALQSCMQALAAGKEEKALLQASITELETKVLALEDALVRVGVGDEERHLLGVQEEVEKRFSDEKATVDVTLKLDMALQDAGAVGSTQRAHFESQLAEDVAAAADIEPERVVVRQLAPEGLVASMSVLPPSDRKAGRSTLVYSTADAANVAASLLAQVHDESSLLRNGVLTRYCTDLITHLAKDPEQCDGTRLGVGAETVAHHSHEGTQAPSEAVQLQQELRTDS